MAAQRRAKRDLKPDELAPAPGEPGGMTIVGILGESPDSGSVRLFLDVRFQTFYEIPSDAIVSRTRVPAERSPLGVDCSAVVVRRGTELTVHQATTRRVEEEFLAGDFTVPGTFVPFHTGGGEEAQTHTCPMPPPPGPASQDPCSALCAPTAGLECVPPPPTGHIGCGSRVLRCSALICGSLTGCPSLLFPACR